MAAALDGQRALPNEVWSEVCPIRARMGIHTGEVDTCEDGHYFGSALFRRGTVDGRRPLGGCPYRQQPRAPGGGPLA